MLLQSLLFACLHFITYNPTQDYSYAYYYDVDSTKTIDNINTINAIPFEHTLSLGNRFGVYWIKVDSNLNTGILVIKNHRIKTPKAFSGSTRLRWEKDTRYPTLVLPKNQSVWIRIDSSTNIHFPLRQYAMDQFDNIEQQRFFNLGLYYGFAFMVFVLNIFYYFFFKESTFLYYALFLLAVTFSLFLSDGLFSVGKSFPSSLYRLETFFHLCIVLFGALFASHYLNYKSHLKSYRLVIHCITVLSISSYIIGLITKQFNWYALGDLINITALSMYWISAIFLFHKNTHSKFFVIAYSLLLFMGYDYFVAPLFDFWSLNISSFTIKLGGVFEMLVLTYAIVFRMNTLNKEYQLLEDTLSTYLLEIDALSTQLERLKKGQSNSLAYANLSLREIEVLTLLSEGKINKEIANALNISPNTVKFHIKNIYTKMEVSSRKEILHQVQ